MMIDKYGLDIVVTTGQFSWDVLNVSQNNLRKDSLNIFKWSIWCLFIYYI